MLIRVISKRKWRHLTFGTNYQCITITNNGDKDTSHSVLIVSGHSTCPGASSPIIAMLDLFLCEGFYLNACAVFIPSTNISFIKQLQKQVSSG